MNTPSDLVFLFDVDNTLLDNDCVERDLRAHLEQEFGAEQSQGYWNIFESLRQELGYADYLGTLQRYRLQYPHHPRILKMSSFLIDYPFKSRLYPSALEVLRHLRQWGTCVVLSDGDVVFQPHKVERSGILEAVGGHALIYVHKEQELDDVERRYPAAHYVLVDDKLRILSTIKGIWGERVTTVFPRQGHYAVDPKVLAAYPSADLSVEHIGDLLHFERSAFLGLSAQSSALELNAAVEAWLAASQAQDWQAFSSYFAPEATVMQAGVTAATPRSVFDGFAGVASQPKDLRVQQSASVAVTSFTLESQRGSSGLCTLVWQRGPNGWRITHLHLST